MNRRTLTTALHLDGAVNVGAGITLVAAGGWLAAPIGLTAGWPLRLAGVLLALYGIENRLVARRPTRSWLTGLGAVDICFATAAFAVAVADPTTAETWVRWAAVAVAVGSVTFGFVKLAGRAALGAVPSDRRTPTA